MGRARAFGRGGGAEAGGSGCGGPAGDAGRGRDKVSGSCDTALQLPLIAGGALNLATGRLAPASFTPIIASPRVLLRLTRRTCSQHTNTHKHTLAPQHRSYQGGPLDATLLDDVELVAVRSRRTTLAGGPETGAAALSPVFGAAAIGSGASRQGPRRGAKGAVGGSAAAAREATFHEQQALLKRERAAAAAEAAAASEAEQRRQDTWLVFVLAELLGSFVLGPAHGNAAAAAAAAAGAGAGCGAAGTGAAGSGGAGGGAAIGGGGGGARADLMSSRISYPQFLELLLLCGALRCALLAPVTCSCARPAGLRAPGLRRLSARDGASKVLEKPPASSLASLCAGLRRRYSGLLDMAPKALAPLVLDCELKVRAVRGRPCIVNACSGLLLSVNWAALAMAAAGAWHLAALWPRKLRPSLRHDRKPPCLPVGRSTSTP